MTKEIWGMFCQFLPDIHTGEIKIAMGHNVYTSKEEAQEACNKIRRQNLPFKGWPVQITDPRT